jgi:hypothetical protein
MRGETFGKATLNLKGCQGRPIARPIACPEDPARGVFQFLGHKSLATASLRAFPSSCCSAPFLRRMCARHIRLLIQDL